MSTSDQRRKAGQLYDSGNALFQQGLFLEALAELQQAADIFRAQDVRGQPFSRPLSNGISGLANSLFLCGLCCQKLGRYQDAVIHYETGFINEKFESKRHFHRFAQSLTDNLVICYQAITESIGPAERKALLSGDHDMDVSFQFPFSLPSGVIAFARLYQLSPDRFAQYEQFYKNALQKDNQLRRLSKEAGQSTAKRMMIYVWAALVIIWVVYGAFVVDALIQNRK